MKNKELPQCHAPVKKDANLQPGKPVKPTNLSARAAMEWDRLTGELERSGIQVTEAHRALLSLAAKIAAGIENAWQVVATDGEYLTNKKTGAAQAHPASKRLDALRRDYIKVLVTLGMRATPAPPPKGDGPTLEDILAG